MGEVDRRIGVGGAISIALFDAVVVLPLSIYFLPWPLLVVVLALVTLLLYLAKAWWEFDIWDLWWWWWWW